MEPELGKAMSSPQGKELEIEGKWQKGLISNSFCEANRVVRFDLVTEQEKEE